MPKEMLPVVDQPLIQHVVDEVREAGIEHLIFVIGDRRKRISFSPVGKTRCDAQNQQSEPPSARMWVDGSSRSP